MSQHHLTCKPSDMELIWICNQCGGHESADMFLAQRDELRAMRNKLAENLSLVTHEMKLLVFAAKEAVGAINDELGQCGKDEIRDHPMLKLHNKIADNTEKQIKRALSAIAKAEGRKQ